MVQEFINLEFQISPTALGCGLRLKRSLFEFQLAVSWTNQQNLLSAFTHVSPKVIDVKVPPQRRNSGKYNLVLSLLPMTSSKSPHSWSLWDLDGEELTSVSPRAPGDP